MKRTALMLVVLGLFFVAQSAQADWTPTKRLTWTSGWSGYPAIAADSSGLLHLIWLDYTPGNTEVYYKKSTDSGTTWTTSRRLTWSSGDCDHLDIVVDSMGNPHVVWSEYYAGNYEVYYKKSTDGGTNWTTKQNLIGPDEERRSDYPVIGADLSGHLHVFWRAGYSSSSQGIEYTESTDWGATWIKHWMNIMVGYSATNPAIEVSPDGGLVWLAFSDNMEGNLEIFSLMSTDGGAHWEGVRRRSWNSGDSLYPDIRSAYGNLHIAWEDDTPGNREIYYMMRPDGGATWPIKKRLTYNSGHSFLPKLALLSSGNVYVFWTNQFPDKHQVCYKVGTNGSTTWTPLKKLAWTSSSQNPSVVVDGQDKIHVVYCELSPDLSNMEIYYKKGN